VFISLKESEFKQEATQLRLVPKTLSKNTQISEVFAEVENLFPQSSFFALNKIEL